MREQPKVYTPYNQKMYNVYRQKVLDLKNEPITEELFSRLVAIEKEFDNFLKNSLIGGYLKIDISNPYLSAIRTDIEILRNGIRMVKAECAKQLEPDRKIGLDKIEEVCEQFYKENWR